MYLTRLGIPDEWRVGKREEEKGSNKAAHDVDQHYGKRSCKQVLQD